MILFLSVTEDDMGFNMTLQPRILVVACAAVLMVSLYVVLECSASAPGSAADFSPHSCRNLCSVSDLILIFNNICKAYSAIFCIVNIKSIYNSTDCIYIPPFTPVLQDLKMIAKIQRCVL